MGDAEHPNQVNINSKSEGSHAVVNERAEEYH